MIAGSADDIVIAEKEHYLRGRDLHEMNELLRAGAREGGIDLVQGEEVTVTVRDVEGERSPVSRERTCPSG